MGVWDEAKHPRGFGGKFGHGTGTAKAPVKKTARQVFASADHAELHKKTVVQLRQDAKTSGLKGHSKSRKADLVDALVVHKRGSTPQKSAPAAAPKKTAREVMHAKPPAKPAAKSTLGKLTNEQVDNGIKMHGTETAKGKQLVEEKRRRAETVVEKTPAVKPKTGTEAVHAAPYLRESDGPARDGVDTKNIDSALTYYKGAGYLGINEDLRKGVKNGREQEDIDAIDAGMGPLTADVEVYRGIHKASKVFGSAWNEHDVTGLTWRDDAFVSVSGDGRASGSAFSSAGGAIMRIRAPKGTKAVGVTDRAEMELLLGRGLTYRVVKDNGVVDGKRRLDVEVVG